MNLPDYSKCIEIKILLQQMGISNIQPLDEIRFTKSTIQTKLVSVPNTEQLNFAKNLKINSINFETSDLKISDNELIEINGIKCCVYIKNQRDGVDIINKSSTYRFHLCNCHTIQEMIRSGRGNRYVATSRDDGLFIVTPQGWGYGQPREYEIRLELCNNCKKILLSKGMYSTPFSLKTFYKNYQATLPATFKRPEQVKVTTQYAPNQHEISYAYRKQANFICQICGVDCSSNIECLHLHHKDGDGTNNRPENLMVLCIICHSKQPHHSQMKRINTESLTTLRKLYDIQGIHNINNI